MGLIEWTNLYKLKRYLVQTDFCQMICTRLGEFRNPKTEKTIFFAKVFNAYCALKTNTVVKSEKLRVRLTVKVILSRQFLQKEKSE